MTERNVHKLPGIEGPETAAAMAELINGALLSSGLISHYDGEHSLITTPDASDLATLKTLTLVLTDRIVAHGADALVAFGELPSVERIVGIQFGEFDCQRLPQVVAR